MTEFYVVRLNGDEIVVLFPNEDNAKWYCNDDKHLSYRAENWKRCSDD